MRPRTGTRGGGAWFGLRGMAGVTTLVCAACSRVAPPVDAVTHDSIGVETADGSSALDVPAIDIAAHDAAPDALVTDATESTLIDGFADDGGQADIATPDVQHDDAGHRIPRFHRPNEDVCRAPPPAGNCAGRARIDCQMDSDCTSGANGVCNIGGIGGCVCTYDACSGDSDCPSGRTCACHGYYLAAGNACVPGNCRVDGDCTDSAYCSPSSTNCLRIAGYYCHTHADECTDDADCPIPVPGGLAAPVCVYSESVAHWVCSGAGGCGI